MKIANIAFGAAFAVVFAVSASPGWTAAKPALRGTRCFTGRTETIGGSAAPAVFKTASWSGNEVRRRSGDPGPDRPPLPQMPGPGRPLTKIVPRRRGDPSG